MSVPTMPPGSSGATNPYVGYAYSPPSAPTPPSAPPKKGRAGLISGVIAGAAAIGLVAGGVGGAVGYLAASNSTTTEAVADTTPAPSSLSPRSESLP